MRSSVINRGGWKCLQRVLELGNTTTVTTTNKTKMGVGDQVEVIQWLEWMPHVVFQFITQANVLGV